MTRGLIGWLALGVVLLGWAPFAPIGAPGWAADKADTDDEWQGLPPGKGREETFVLCGACHSLKLVTQQGLSRSRWDETIDWMVEKQEMEPLGAEERGLIIDYLAEFYGPDRKAVGRKKLRR